MPVILKPKNSRPLFGGAALVSFGPPPVAAKRRGPTAVLSKSEDQHDQQARPNANGRPK